MATIALNTLVERLQRLSAAEFTVPRVTELLGDGALEEASLRPYIGALPHKYARRLVHRGPHFEMLILTWSPGQYTPVHNHAGSCGWVRLVRGQIAEDSFTLVPGTQADALLGDDPARCGGRVGLVPTGSGVISQVGAVAAVDRVRAIHRLGNPAVPGGDTTVTLHVYAPAHDACLAFDVEQRTCARRQLAYDV